MRLICKYIQHTVGLLEFVLCQVEWQSDLLISRVLSLVITYRRIKSCNVVSPEFSAAAKTVFIPHSDFTDVKGLVFSSRLLILTDARLFRTNLDLSNRILEVCFAVEDAFQGMCEVS